MDFYINIEAFSAIIFFVLVLIVWMDWRGKRPW